MGASGWRGVEGSASLELVLLVPVLMLLVLFVLWAGRGGRATLTADLAAEEAATVAALCCDEHDVEGRERAVEAVLGSRPGLDFLCIGGPRPVGERFVSQESLYFDPTDGGSFGGVGVLEVAFACESDGAVAPLRGVFPTVTFEGRASEVVLLSPPLGAVSGVPLVSVADVTVLEGAGRAVFVLELDAVSHLDVTVSYLTADGSATAGPAGDYLHRAGTVTMFAGERSATVEVPIINDLLDEPAEEFSLLLLHPQNATLERTAAAGTIEDNDGPVRVSVTAGPAVPEGEEVEFYVELDKSSGWLVSVELDTADLSATAGSDYGELVDHLVSFTPGETWKQVPVLTKADEEAEEDESFRVRLSKEMNAELAVDEADGWILDNNPPRVWIRDAIGIESIDGTVTKMTFEVALSRPSDDVVTVDWATEDEDPPGDSAAEGGVPCGNALHKDYQIASGSVEFAVDRALTQTIEVDICYDDDDPGGVDEDDETFRVVLSNPVNAELDQPGPDVDPAEDAVGVGTIAAQGAVWVSDPEPVFEGDGVLQFDVRLTGESTVPVSVDVQTADGSALSNEDYTPLTTRVTISPGEPPVVVVAVTLKDDADCESPREETFTLTLSVPSEDTRLIPGRESATGTIVDDDCVPLVDIDGVESPGAHDASGVEGETLSFRVWLTHPSRLPVSVDWRTREHSATGGDPCDEAGAGDYGTVDSDTVRFDLVPGSDYTGTELFVEVVTCDDDVDEFVETFDALLTGATNATLRGVEPSGLGRIEDNDEVEIFIDGDEHDDWDSASGTEGERLRFRVRLSNPSSREITATYATVELRSAGDAAALGGPTCTSADARDYEQVQAVHPGTVTFDPNDTVATIEVVTCGDDIDETDLERFKVELLTAAYSSETITDRIAIAGDSAIGTIRDDDDPPTVSVAGAEVTEGGVLEFTVTLSEPAGRPVTVDWATALDGSPGAHAATGGGPCGEAGESDYVTASDDEVTFAVDPDTGATADADLEATIAVQTCDDDLFEGDETMLVRLTAAANADLDPDPDGGSEATGTIVENDWPTVTVGDVSANEGTADVVDGEELMFTLELDKHVVRPFTVTYWTTELAPDDPDRASATAGDDFEPIDSPGGTFTFTVGARRHEVTVTVEDDDLDEPDESLLLNVEYPTAGEPATVTAVGTIVDDDVPLLSIDGVEHDGWEGASATEGETLRFRVRLSNPSTREVTVMVRTVQQRTGDFAVGGASCGAGVDYETVASDSLTFAVDPATGTTGTEATIEVRSCDDSLDEPDETLLVQLYDPNEYAFIADEYATGTIEDNDDPPTVTLVAGAAVDEGGRLSFRVLLSGSSGRPVTVGWATARDLSPRASPATGGGPCGSETERDYVTAPDGEVTFAVDPATGATLTGQVVEVRVQTCEDDLFEGDETMLVRLTAAGGAAIAVGGGEATGTIVDDDWPTVNVGNVRANEGDEKLEFTLRLSNDVVRRFTVSYWTTELALTAPDRATAPDDFSSVQRSDVVFEVGSRSRVVEVTVVDDDLDEPDESLLLNVEYPTAGEPATVTAVGTIVDDDVPLLSIDGVEHDGWEGASATEGETLQFRVRLSNPSTREVTVMVRTVQQRTGDFAVGGASCGAGVDYETVASDSLTFAVDPATGTTGTEATIEVRSCDDSLDEPDETLLVQLYDPNEYAFIADEYATGTIEDNDDPPTVTLVAGAAVDEGGRLSFRVLLSGSSGRPVTVGWATARDLSPRASPATGGGPCGSETERDYVTAPDGEVTFAVDPATGATLTGQVVEVRVQTCEDDLFEGDETMLVRLTAAGGAAIAVGGGEATGTIVDDDWPTVNVGNVRANEGDEKLEFTLRLSNDVVRRFTVSYWTTELALTAPDRATAPDDFSSVQRSDVVFEVGSRSRVVEVTVVDDDLDEPDESLLLNVEYPTAGEPATVTAVGTIVDDDVPLLSIDGVEHDGWEGASATEGGTLQFRVRLSNPSTREVTVMVRTVQQRTGDFAVGGTECGAGVDYETYETDDTEPLTFAVDPATGTTGTEATIEVQSCDDSLDEPDETLLVELHNPNEYALIADEYATGTIEDDDDPPTVTLVDDAAVTEGGVLSFRVLLSGSSGREVTVRWATVESSGAYPATGGGLCGSATERDYVTGAGRLTFAVDPATGATADLEATIEVQTCGDVLFEGDETLLVRLANPSGAAIADGGGEATGTIVDDDVPLLSVAAGSADEGEPLEFPVILSDPSTREVTVMVRTVQRLTGDFAVGGDSCTAGVDYETYETDDTAPLKFAAGETRKTVRVQSCSDSLDEPDETFLVELHAPVGALIDADGGRTAVGTINGQCIDVGNPAHGVPGIFPHGRFTLDEGAGAPFVAFVADPAFCRGSVGQMWLYTRDVSASVDVLPAVGGRGFLDDAECSGLGLDYVFRERERVSFHGPDSRLTVNQRICQDDVDEGNETYEMVLEWNEDRMPRNYHGLGEVLVATITILDDDNSVVSVGAADAREGEPLEFPVTLSNPSTREVTVMVRTVQRLTGDFAVGGDSCTAGVDYETYETDDTAPLRFAVDPDTGTTADLGATIEVQSCSDSLDEPDETFLVELHAPVGAPIDAGTAIGTINPWCVQVDNPAHAAPSLVPVRGLRVREDAGISTLMYRVDPPFCPGSHGRMRLNTRDGSAAGAPSASSRGDPLRCDGDYVHDRLREVRFDQSPTLELNYSICDDLVDEPEESFEMVLTWRRSLMPEHYRDLGEIATTITIRDDDTSAVSVGAAAASEGELLRFPVTLSPANSRDVTVSYTTRDSRAANAATAVDDYTPRTGTVTILAGATGASVEVRALDDDVIEGDEVFLFEITGATVPAEVPGGAINLDLDGAAAVGTINGQCIDVNIAAHGVPEIVPVGELRLNEGDDRSVISFRADPRFCEGSVGRTQNPTRDVSAVGGSRVFSGDARVCEGHDGDYVSWPVWSNVSFTDSDLQNLTMHACDDLVDEGDETFEMVFIWREDRMPPHYHGRGEVLVATVTIVDNDTSVVSVGAADALEGELLEFPVTLSAANSRNVTVNYRTSVDGDADHPATPVLDFEVPVSTATIVIPAGDTSGTIRVQSLSDEHDEPDETFLVELTGVDHGQLGVPHSAVGTINPSCVDVNNPAHAPPRIVPVGEFRLNEGGSDPSIGFRAVPGFCEGSVGRTRNYTRDVSAVGGRRVFSGDARECEGHDGDYVSWVNSNVSFFHSHNTQTLSMNTCDDSVDEADETFEMVFTWREDLMPPHYHDLGEVIAATITIIDDDTSAVSVGAADALEGDLLAFPVTLSPANSRPVTVNYRTSVDGDADHPATPVVDFDVPEATAAIVIPAGDTSGTIPVQSLPDDDDEPDETFLVELTGVDHGQLRDSTAVGTINTCVHTDNPNHAPPSLTPIGELTFDEGADNPHIFFRFVPRFCPGSHTLNWYRSDDGASDTPATGVPWTNYGDPLWCVGGDYISGPGGTFSSLSTVGMDIHICEDSVDEGDETFDVVLVWGDSMPQHYRDVGETFAGTVTIRDNDTSLVSVDDASAAEGDALRFPVTLSVANSRDVTVSYRTSVDGDADDPATPVLDFDVPEATAAIVIPAGDTSGTISVQSLSDDDDEPSETFRVELTGVDHGQLRDSTAIGTITPCVDVTNPAHAPPSIVPVGGLTMGEGAGRSNIQFRLDPPMCDGSTGWLLSVPSPTGSAIGASFVFPVEDPQCSDRLPPHTEPGVDYIYYLINHLTFVGSAEVSDRFHICEDFVDEVDETFERVVTWIESSMPPHYRGLGSTSFTYTILDNDTSAVWVSSGRAAEGAALRFTVRLDLANSRDVTVSYTTSDIAGLANAATAYDDYTPRTGTVTIPAGEMDVVVEVQSLHDDVSEGDEIFSFDITGATVPGGVIDFYPGVYPGVESSIRGTIFNVICDERIAAAPPPTLSIVPTEIRITEGASVPVTATMSSLLCRDVGVKFPVVAGTATPGDYLATTLWGSSYQISAGNRQAIRYLHTNEDNLDEEDETATLLVSWTEHPQFDMPSHYLDVPAIEIPIVILDDDDPPAISVAGATANAGTAVVFEVTLSEPSGRQVTVDYRTIAVGGTNGGTDCGSATTDFVHTSGTLTFDAVSTRGDGLPRVLTVEVPTCSNLGDEGDETFLLELTNPVNVDLGDRSAVGTIRGVDCVRVDDATRSPPTFTIGWSSFFEDVAAAGVSIMPFTFSHELCEDFFLEFESYATSGSSSASTAVDGLPPEADFNIVTGTNVVFQQPNPYPPDWSISLYLRFVLDDALDEDDETFGIRFNWHDTLMPSHFQDEDGVEVVVTLIDDDPTPVISVAGASALAGEEMVFTVRLNAPTGRPATVDYAVTGVTATAGADFVATSGTLRFEKKPGNQPSETEMTFTVKTVDDGSADGPETFSVVLSNPQNLDLGAATATGTILDAVDCVNPNNPHHDPPTITAGTSQRGTEGLAPEAFTRIEFGLSVPFCEDRDNVWRWETVAGTATAGEDYTASSGVGSVTASSSILAVGTIPIINDALDEDNETVYVRVSWHEDMPERYQRPGHVDMVNVIRDNDPPPALIFADAAADEGDSVVFNLGLSVPSGRGVSVQYRTADQRGNPDGATAGDDYLYGEGTVEFAPGEVSMSVSVTTVTDGDDEEGSERFLLQFFNPTNAAIVGRDHAIGTID